MSTRNSALIAALLFSTATACGVFHKKRGSSDVGTGGPPPAQADGVNVDPVALKISAPRQDASPNDLLVDSTGKRTIHAQFTYVAAESYELRLASVLQEFTNCQGDRPPAVLSWTGDGIASPITLTQEGAFAADSGKTYALTVDVDNAVAQCATVHISFTVFATKASKATPPPPGPTPPSPPPPERQFPVPLTAGLASVGALSDAEGCKVTGTKTVADLLRKPGQPATGDRDSLEVDVLGMALTVKAADALGLAGMFDLSSTKETIAAIQGQIKAGKLVKVTTQSQCAVSGSDPVYFLRDYYLTPDPALGADGADPLELEANPSGGQLAYGVSYAYDADFSWMITFTTKIAPETLTQLPQNVRYAIYNAKAGAFINDWQSIPASALQVGQLKITDKTVLRRLLAHQAELQLIFDAEPSSRLLKKRYVLAIGDECRKFVASYFKDLSNPGKRCFELKEGDLPQ